MRLRLLAIQKILIVIIVLSLVFSVLGVLVSGQPPYIAVFYSIMNILGSDFIINSALVDVPSKIMLSVQVLDVVGNLMLTILITTAFYQLLSRLDIRYIIARSKIKRLKKHVVITPANEMALLLSKRLKEHNVGSVVVDKDFYKVVRLLGDGVLAYHGNPTDQAVLDAVNVGSAESFITLDKDDVSNLYVAMSAKKANKKIRVVSRLKRLEDMMKLEKVGVERVVLPELAISKEVGAFLADKLSG